MLEAAPYSLLYEKRKKYFIISTLREPRAFSLYLNDAC